MKFIIVYGISGSGKTTISSQIQNILLENGVHCEILSLDNFYKEGVRDSFDVPDAFDWDRIHSCINTLKQNNQYDIREYRYDICHYTDAIKDRIYPCKVLIIEGLYANYCRSVLLDEPAVVHINTPLDICLARRIIRDNEERNLEPIQNTKRWMDDVRVNWIKWNDTDLSLDQTHSIPGYGITTKKREELIENVILEYEMIQ